MPATGGSLERSSDSDASGSGSGSGSGRKANGKASLVSNPTDDQLDANHNLQHAHASIMSGATAVINGYDAAHNVNEKLALNDNGSFTERAVDVPVDFVGSKKEPPRWPGRSTATPQNGNTLNSTTGSITSQHDRTASNRSADEQLDTRVRFHEDELRKRREDEERLARERELLRDSLRGSAKLRALERGGSRGKTPVGIGIAGVVNVAYDGDAERENVQNLVRERSSSRRIKPSKSTDVKSSKASEVQQDSKYDVTLDTLTIDRLLLDIQSQLWSPANGSTVDSAFKDELVAVQQLLRSDSTRRLLATCDLVTRSKQRVDNAPPASPNAAALADDIVDQLATFAENRSMPQRSRQDASALSELLSSPVLTSLLLAHDKIANAVLSSASTFGFAFLEPPSDAQKRSETPSRADSASSSDSRQKAVVAIAAAAAADEDLARLRSVDADEHVYADAQSDVRGLANPAFIDEDNDDRLAFPAPNDAAVVRLSDSTEVQVVKLTRVGDEFLGATIRNEGSGALIIGRILKGGLVERIGLLHEGDELLEINDIDMRGRTVNDAYDLISEMRGTLTFIVAPNKEYSAPPTRKQPFYLRALFEYNAADDPYVPCRELSVEFKRGDILCVFNDDDPSWWQARLVQQNGRSVQTSEDQLPFLIPSPTFYRERERLRRQIAKESEERNKDSSLCSCFRRKKRRKTATFTELTADTNQPEVLTYDEVTIYYPQPNRKRPIVLVGVEKVGRLELRERLLKTDADRFAGAVPHTTRLQEDESDGVDFHFVSRQAFDRDAKAGRFIEYGEYERNLYGTSIESVKSVISSGKVCVLALHADSLRVLDETDLKPFVVFVAPPDLERLRTLRAKQSPGQRVTDDDLKAIIETSRQMDLQFGHYFDWALTFIDLEQAYRELLAVINRLEVEPQYIPSRWVRNSATIYGTLPADVNLRPPTAEISSQEASHYENIRVISGSRSGSELET